MSRKDHAEAQRARIIDAAIRVMAREGVQATTTRKLAAEADVNLATLAYYFGSKGQLLTAVLQSLIQKTGELVQDTLSQDLPLPQSLANALRVYWQHVEKYPELELIQQELNLYVLRDPEVAWIARDYYMDFSAIIATMIDSYLEPSEAFTNVDLARFIMVGIDGLVLQYLSDRDKIQAQRRLEHFTNAILALVSVYNIQEHHAD